MSPTTSMVAAAVFGLGYFCSGEEYPLVQVVCWVASAACLAHTLNDILCMLERPVPCKSQSPICPNHPLVGSRNDKMVFPWKEAQDEESSSYQSESEWLSIFDLQARRQKKWDVERRKWRELQHQLSILRTVRAQRQQRRGDGTTTTTSKEDALSPSSKTTTVVAQDHVAFQDPLPSPPRKTTRVPWNSNNTNRSLFDNLKSFLHQWNQGSLLHWIMDPDYRHKLKWEKERLRWRELQQQLGSLRVIRASKNAAGTQWKSTTQDISVVVQTNKKFPWNEETSTNCGALEWCFSSFSDFYIWPSAWIRWLSDAEYRRTLKWDKERRRWRDLQQQLGEVRIIRTSREAAGTQWKPRANEIQVAGTMQRFPWKTETSTNCTAIEWLQSIFPVVNLRENGLVRGILEGDYRRTQKWEVERKRWRDLQQQLGSLRVLRVSRQAAATQWKSDDIKVIPGAMNQKFPWKEEPRTYNGSAWLGSFFSLFSSERYRERKWNSEREKWRELQQQLGKLRSIRAENEKSAKEGAAQDLGNDQKKFVALKYVLS